MRFDIVRQLATTLISASLAACLAPPATESGIGLAVDDPIFVEIVDGDATPTLTPDSLDDLVDGRDTQEIALSDGTSALAFTGAGGYVPELEEDPGRDEPEEDLEGEQEPDLDPEGEEPACVAETCDSWFWSDVVCCDADCPCDPDCASAEPACDAMQEDGAGDEEEPSTTDECFAEDCDSWYWTGESCCDAECDCDVDCDDGAAFCGAEGGDDLGSSAADTCDPEACDSWYWTNEYCCDADCPCDSDCEDGYEACGYEASGGASGMPDGAAGIVPAVIVVYEVVVWGRILYIAFASAVAAQAAITIAQNASRARGSSLERDIADALARAVPRAGTNNPCTSSPTDCCGDFLIRFRTRLKNAANGYWVYSAGGRGYDCCFEWDAVHGDFEVFGRGGQHLGTKSCDDAGGDPCAVTSGPSLNATPGGHFPRRGCIPF